MANKRTRRTPEQMIKDLEARIAEVKARAERKKTRRDPTLKHVNSALRSIDKALSEASDTAIRGALGEARATLAACLSMAGASPRSGRGVLIPQARPSAQVESKTVLEYLRKNPGSRSEAIASALGTDTRSLRPILQGLRNDGEARSQGQGRATSYYAQTSR